MQRNNWLACTVPYCASVPLCFLLLLPENAPVAPSPSVKANHFLLLLVGTLVRRVVSLHHAPLLPSESIPGAPLPAVQEHVRGGEEGTAQSVDREHTNAEAFGPAQQS